LKDEKSAESKEKAKENETESVEKEKEKKEKEPDFEILQNPTRAMKPQVKHTTKPHKVHIKQHKRHVYLVF
jgi:hypothetical protein